MRAAVELEGSGARRILQIVVLLFPALTVIVKGGAKGSLMIAAALSLLVLLRQRPSTEGMATARSNEPVRSYALAMAAPVFVLLAVQTLHGGPWAVGVVSSSARFLLAVPVVLFMRRIGRALVPWADDLPADTWRDRIKRMGYAVAGYPLTDLAQWEPDLPNAQESNLER
jgi:hypothetical protein